MCSRRTAMTKYGRAACRCSTRRWAMCSRRWAGPLRGRKRDVWEGGHRVPGIISMPRLVGDVNRVSWTPVTTMDMLPTVLALLGNVSRPAAQAGWATDGASVLPLLMGGERFLIWRESAFLVWRFCRC